MFIVSLIGNIIKIYYLTHTHFLSLASYTGTITTRNAAGEPTAGAVLEDFKLYHAPELLDPSPLQGGPIYWFVDFATCAAGAHNVTVQHAAEVNVTTQAVVVPGATSNFTLDCRRGREVVTAGERVSCLVTTLDACDNPTSTPPESPSTWHVHRFGYPTDAAAIYDGDSVIPDLGAVSRDGSGGGSASQLTSRYIASFGTGAFWTSALNYTEHGRGGLRVVYTNANWTEERSSDVGIRASSLSADRTRVQCYPLTGLLQGHIATCRVTTFDAYANPQVCVWAALSLSRSLA